LAGQLAANHPDDALQYLREAINRGYKDVDGLMADADLEKLRPNSNLQQLVAELKTHARKVQPNRGSYVRLHRLLGPLLCLATRKSPSDRPRPVRCGAVARRYLFSTMSIAHSKRRARR
jgi:hypothetical protein